MELACLGLVVALAIGVPTGIVAALNRGRAGDYLANIFVLLGLSVPSFWLAVLLILLFSLKLGWLPPTGYISPGESLGGNLVRMVLPAVSLGLALAAAIGRIVRSCLLEVLARAYVRTARAKGLNEAAGGSLARLAERPDPGRDRGRPAVRYAARGAVIIEQIFSLPGIGRFALEGIDLRDYPVVQGAVVAIAFSFILVNLCVDVCYGFIDPRVRYG